MEKQRNTVSWVRGKCIGKGSFGTVNLAFNKQDGAVFAVKSVARSACGLLQVGALENEIRILRSLRSPYVVGFLGDDVSYEASTLYRNLHMEYLPGGDVADLARRGGADVDEKIMRSCAWCVVSALRYVHAQGIVHCDVKGRNILVDSVAGSAKLADFGSAVELSGGAPTMPRGSPLWMAPEVIRGEYQGPESDVWSLGCTIIEMLTGKPAWVDNGIDTLSRIGFSDEQPGLPNQLSELGRDFVEKCLRRDQSRRWSCDQLMQHPFISSASPNTIAESSPRCVLDWFSISEFNEHEEEYDDVTAMNSSSSCDEASAKERVGKLARNSGANWESEGWTVVRRSCAAETEEEAGTSSAAAAAAADSDSVRIRERRTVGRAEWEFRDSCGGSDLLCGHPNGPTTVGLLGWFSKSGGRCESQKVDTAEERRGDLAGFYYGFSNLLLFVLQFLTIFRHNYSSFATYIICFLLALHFFSHREQLCF